MMKIFAPKIGATVFSHDDDLEDTMAVLPVDCFQVLWRTGRPIDGSRL